MHGRHHGAQKSTSSGAPAIAVATAPRARAEVDFQVHGDPARIARLLTAGWFRRRFSRRVARVRGRREGVAALSALLGTPLDLRELHRAGIRLDPATALALVAAMIEPEWTRGQRFALAHEDPRAASTVLIVQVQTGQRSGFCSDTGSSVSPAVHGFVSVSFG